MTVAALPGVAPSPAADAVEITISTAGDETASEWDRFVCVHPDAYGYHAWGWRDVIGRTFGHESIYLVARSDGRMVGALPLVFINSRLFGRSLTSLPFLNYGGVVADSPEVAARLVEAAADVARERRCPHVELRHVQRRFPSLPVRQHKVTMLLHLGPGMWERLDRKVRNQVRKAQKSGLTVGQGGAELVDDFYAVFARNMRDLGTPVYPRRLFEQVLRTFPERAAIHVVRLGGRPIAAGLTHTSNGTVEVPWASSVRDFNGFCPNHLLYWSVIEAAVERGCRTMDFGRSTRDEGTFKFKEQWGAEPVPLHWEYRLIDDATVPNVSPSNRKYRVMIETWKRLPLRVANLIGPRIVGSIA